MADYSEQGCYSPSISARHSRTHTNTDLDKRIPVGKCDAPDTIICAAI